jgi:hypothetical protein
MLERCSRNFRFFLKALEGEICPLCAVVAALEQEEADRFALRNFSGSPRALCGRHLRLALNVVGDPRDRTNLVRAILSPDHPNTVHLTAPCDICQLIEGSLVSLAFAIRRFDGRVRFEKTLAGAPLFCRFHAAQICADGSAPGFARIQRGKVKSLGDDLARALLRSGAASEQLINSALRYIEGEPPISGNDDRKAVVEAPIIQEVNGNRPRVSIDGRRASLPATL